VLHVAVVDVVEAHPAVLAVLVFNDHRHGEDRVLARLPGHTGKVGDVAERTTGGLQTAERWSTNPQRALSRPRSSTVLSPAGGRRETAVWGRGSA